MSIARQHLPGGVVAVSALALALAGCCSAPAVRETADGVKVRKIYVADYRERMKGAWLGQMVGVEFGMPTEFLKQGELWSFEELPVWKPEMVNGAFDNDDLYVEMTFLRTLETRGIDVSARQAGIDFANSRYRLWCANFNARNCLRKGIAAPSSSHPSNHATTDDIDYQIESDFSGIISPGMPARAVRLGEQFGRIMNYGDGLYAGQFVGAMYATAFFEPDRVKVVEAALKCIPEKSKYAMMVRDMLKWRKSREYGPAWHKVWELVVAKYLKEESTKGKVTWRGIDAKLNGAMILLGYLWGEGDVEKTMKIAAAAGFDSDCNPSNALGILGAQQGAKAFAGKYDCALDRGRTFAHTPYKWDDLLAVSEKLAREIVVAEGGSIGRDFGGEYFLVPENKPAVLPAVDSSNPGPGGDDRYTEEEMKEISFLPQQAEGQEENKLRNDDK